MAMLSHRQGCYCAVVLAFFPCFILAHTTSDDPPVAFRTTISEVRISFFATDGENRNLENLSRDDFAVIDNGTVIRDFRSLQRSADTSLDILLLVDTSESVATRWSELQSTALALLAADAVAGDNISIVTFSGVRPTLLCKGDCRTPSARERLHGLKPEGATPLFDALAYSARILSDRREPMTRQVVILLSDGNDTISMSSSQAAVEQINASGGAVYALNLARPGTVSQGGVLLQQIADATGGRSLFLQEHSTDFLQTMLADLHGSYVVTYQLPHPAAGFHSLRILPKHDLNLRFHCRRGYNYEEVR